MRKRKNNTRQNTYSPFRNIPRAYRNLVRNDPFQDGAEKEYERERAIRERKALRLDL